VAHLPLLGGILLDALLCLAASIAYLQPTLAKRIGLKRKCGENAEFLGTVILAKNSLYLISANFTLTSQNTVISAKIFAKVFKMSPFS
jgi:hypothetical protein